ncbi:MAG: ABC transporter substrate-binding protein [Ktedonobacteraceae bacterium]|nr:ABC transporter substrate-binding protein [Ktedonobacteraceae bacterium]
MKCTNCGTDNPAGEDYCSECGLSLDASANPAPATIVSTGNNSGSIQVATGNSGGFGGPVTGGGGPGTSRVLTPNSQLENGRYVVEKILGQGGMGAAVLARDTRISDKPVVIKELVSDGNNAAQRQEDVLNFKREVKTLANLRHPLIPTVTDSFQEGSRYYMVQEYAPGENLEDHMEHLNKPMPEEEALTYISQVLHILDYLGRQTPPVVHRDIKPANIIISSSDHSARLVDFGIARADEAKKQTIALGTPGYAPPEQYQGNADGRSDLYALAATLHHLVTNRDPRNYPPFNYPRASSINPQVSPKLEKVLEHALAIDVKQRYQTAAEMKHDIDDILHPPGLINNSSGSGTSGGPNSPPPRRQNSLLWGFGLLALGLLLIGTLIFAIPFFSNRNKTSTGQNGSSVGSSSSDPISTTMVNGEPLGLSYGKVAFDTNRPDCKSCDYKKQAAEKLVQGDGAGAQSLWRAVIGQDSSDAEAHIYLENQSVLASGRPYITLVVGTILTGQDASIGRENLQGAYIAQKEYNANNGALLGGIQVRLLIANAGSNSGNVQPIAKQIVQAIQKDSTIVGVMGWTFSAQSINAMQVLTQAKIPMVAESASSDDLTNSSSYFFRVVPPNSEEAKVGASYAKGTLNARTAVVFSDPGDSYSRSLAEDFSKSFTSLGGQAQTVSYTRKDAQSISAALKQVANQGAAPDLIYFAGYAYDINTVLIDLPQYNTLSNTKILGGDALYELGGYDKKGLAAFSRLHFTAFAYPDEWTVLNPGHKKPTFFQDYIDAFSVHNPQNQVYGFTRPTNNVMLSYDATVALLIGVKNGLNGGKSLTPDKLQQALQQIKGANAIQGVSGVISLGADGNPENKLVIVLAVDNENHIKMEPYKGTSKLVP